jgi:hypothetical protein
MLPSMADPPGSASAMTVVLIRAWYENDGFRARIVFLADEPEARRSVVVGSIDEACAVVRAAIDPNRRHVD